MHVSLPADLTKRLQQEIEDGNYSDADAVVEHAVRRFLDLNQRGADRLEALRRIGNALEQAGLYERVRLPDSQ